jgi:DNA ligase-1
MSDLFDTIAADDLATAPQGFKKTLWKLDSTGKTREWNISVTDEDGKAKILIESGIKGGKFVPMATFVAKGKNVGRANETTYMQQAIMDAQSKMKKQLKDGYTDDPANMVAHGTKGSGALGTMLARIYDPTGTQSSGKTLDKWGIENELIGAQYKLDGVRRFSFLNMVGVEMYTRTGDPSSTLPHIEKELHESFLRLVKLMPHLAETGMWVDGEAYNHDIPFNLINGITRKGAVTDEEKAARLLIKYHVYDVANEDGYEVRSKLLDHFVSEHVEVVPVEYMLATDENLKAFFEKAIAAGYEGAMIRVLGKPYQHHRSNYLLKFKAFEDAEFLIVGAEPTVDGDRVGAFIMKMNEPSYDRSGKIIETFKATPKCSHVEKIWAWNNLDKFIGQKATVDYFGLSEYGVPRFPRLKDLRYDL